MSQTASAQPVATEISPEPEGLSLSRLHERAKLLQAMQLTEQALLAVSDGRLHYRLIDLYVEVLRELQTLYEANIAVGAATRETSKD